MTYKKILTIQDISCLGQCSLTVALPILSACGNETCIIPSAVLSNHTGGFSGFTFRDLSEDIPLIKEQWEKEGVFFDAVYTGYLGSAKQIEYVLDIIESRKKKDAEVIVDPAMADFGVLYKGFDENYVEAMKKLCFSGADVILPNITEACYLTGIEYKEDYDEAYVESLVKALSSMGAKTIVLTGVGYTEGTTGVLVYENGRAEYYKHNKIKRSCHGTGDVYASVFVGALMKGFSVHKAAQIAADFTVECIEITSEDKEHWYGVKFELLIPKLIKMFEEYR